MNYVLASIFVCIIQVSYTYAIPATNQKQFKGINPASLVTIGNDTYYISPNEAEVSNLVATKFCNDDGMKLISFETEEEWLRVAGYMENNGYSGEAYWTSGRKFLNDYQWTGSGQMFTFNAWNTEEGQPDSSGTTVCVLFYSEIGLGWFDEDCSLSRSFICEF